MSLLTVGTVAFDSINTPHGKADRVIGGACTYISIAASYFTKDIYLVSVIGDDFPREILNDLENRGVNLDGLEIRKGERSFFWEGSYHDDMNSRDTLVTDLNVLATFQPKVPATCQKPDFVMLGNLTPAVQASVLDQLTHRPKLIMMDTMNFWMDVALDELKQVLKRIDILAINDEEARQLSGERSLVKAFDVIRTMGPKTVVIKKGEHGAFLFSEGKQFYAPALPLHTVVDPTGAGDTFAGGMIGYLAGTGDISWDNLKRAIIHGSALASYCVEDFSIHRIANVTQTELKHRVQAFAQLVHFDIPV